MSSWFSKSGSTPRVEHILPPRKAKPPAAFAMRGFLVVSCLLLLTSILSAWSFLTPSVLAAPLPSPTQATNTVQNFSASARARRQRWLLHQRLRLLSIHPIATKNAAAVDAGIAERRTDEDAGTDLSVGYNWIPGYDGTQTPHPDGDWTDYYHAEYRGFNYVYITSSAGNLTADHYVSTEGWGTPQSDGANYNSG